MPINLTGPAMEVARIGSILKASKAKEEQKKLKEAQLAETNKYINYIKTMPTPEQFSKEYNNTKAQNAWMARWTQLYKNWDQPMSQKGLQTAAKAQEGKEASMNMRIAHKENVYKGGKRF
jgi:hypothetical protein